jgi:hypothetical protein
MRFGLIGCLSIAIAVAGMIVLLLVGPYRDTKLRFQIAKCQVEAANLVAAINSYEAECGKTLESSNAAILQALRGQNSKKLVFLDIDIRLLDENWSMVDPWRTPYLIQINSTNRASIRSAGPNKQFGDADDVISPP